ncbi:MAG: rod shape-determining protein MreC [Treponema sp.]|nr:rod shape-determining protein MreC [Treponema sp.]
MKNRRFNFRPTEFILIVLVLFSGINLGFSSGSFVLNFKTAGFTVFSAIQKGIGSVTGAVGGFFTSIKELSNLKEEYDVLKEKLADYEFMQKTNTTLRAENDTLRELLGFAKSSEYRTVSARIIARDKDTLYSAITLNKGAKHGIKKGMCVIAIQNGSTGVVGKIVTVGYLTSMIMPVYDRHCNISARIQNTRDSGLMSGNGTQESFLKLRYIKKRYIEDLSIGDLVLTSGENDSYIRDIPIGRISKITDIEYDTSLDIEVDPVIDFSRLENVIAIDLDEENPMKQDSLEGAEND